jgi:hypothetical protein
VSWVLWFYLWSQPAQCFSLGMTLTGCTHHHLPVSDCEAALLYVCRHPDTEIVEMTRKQINNGP